MNPTTARRLLPTDLGVRSSNLFGARQLLFQIKDLGRCLSAQWSTHQIGRGYVAFCSCACTTVCRSRSRSQNDFFSSLLIPF